MRVAQPASRKRRRTGAADGRLLACALLVVGAALATAGTEDLPGPTIDTATPSTGFFTRGFVIQQRFPAAELAGLSAGDRIVGFSMRPAAGGVYEGTTFSRFEVRMGVATPGQGVVLAANFVGGSERLVRQGPLVVRPGDFVPGPAPRAFATPVLFDVPYTYEGGDLLLETRSSKPTADLLIDVIGEFTPASNGDTAVEHRNGDFNSDATLADSGPFLVSWALRLYTAGPAEATAELRGKRILKTADRDKISLAGEARLELAGDEVLLFAGPGVPVVGRRTSPDASASALELDAAGRETLRRLVQADLRRVKPTAIVDIDTADLQIRTNGARTRAAVSGKIAFTATEPTTDGGDDAVHRGFVSLRLKGRFDR